MTMTKIECHACDTWQLVLFAIKTVCVCALEVQGHHVTRPTVEWTKVWPVYISKLDNAKLSRCTFFTQTHWKYVVLFNRKLLIFASHLDKDRGRQASLAASRAWMWMLWWRWIAQTNVVKSTKHTAIKVTFMCKCRFVFICPFHIHIPRLKRRTSNFHTLR